MEKNRILNNIRLIIYQLFIIKLLFIQLFIIYYLLINTLFIIIYYLQ